MTCLTRCGLEKGEIALYEQFRILLQCLQKWYAAEASKYVYMWVRGFHKWNTTHENEPFGPIRPANTETDQTIPS